MVNNQKKNRVLDIFYRAFKGEELSVSNLASEYEVSTKSITRDINEIKNFLADNRDVVGNSELLYSYQSKTYSLKFNHFLVSKELVAIVKILVGCRALSKEELLEIIYVFLTIFLYLLKCPQSLILSALRAFCFCCKPHISRSIFLYFLYQTWLKSW